MSRVVRVEHSLGRPWIQTWISKGESNTRSVPRKMCRSPKRTSLESGHVVEAQATTDLDVGEIEMAAEVEALD